MLKKVTAIFLITSLLAVNFSRFFIYAGFELNKKYIISTLCENRDKPWLHCNGKCFFMKKIKQQQENEKNNEQQSQKNLFQEAFCMQPLIIKFHTQLLQVIPIPNHRITLPRAYAPVFRPPQLG